MSDDPELDIVDIILLACRTGGLAPLAADTIEQSIRTKYGGQRMRIPKTRKHMTPEQRQAAYRDGLTSAPDSEITAKYKISSRTLQRLMKTGA